MYNSNSYKEPFWAENKGFMTGRDPLGIQNSSMATYGRLLPGMTNLTLRLRYYGFYMWVLSEYNALIKNEVNETLTYHYNFIRRAELAIAYFMTNKYPNEKSIVGSDFANNNTDTIKELGYYDLARGADKNKDTTKRTVYWDYTSGALGQYFAGSLINLQLIEMSNRFFIILEKGEQLANAFNEGISDSSRQTFLRVIETGRLTSIDIDGLSEFSINTIRPDSAEWRFYSDMILADDGTADSLGKNQTQRRETIKHYLEYVYSKPLSEPSITFDHVQYLKNIDEPSNDASFGWYYYRINELFHYALETIFWGLLVELDGKIVDIRKFMENVSKSVTLLSQEDYLKTAESTISQILISGFGGSLKSDQGKLELLVKEGQSNKEAIALAFKMILRIYLENKSHMDLLYGYEKANYLSDKKGRISDVVNSYINTPAELPFREFVFFCIKHLINDHISTAYRKMGAGEANLLKFVIEDNLITHVQTMKPNFTSPRLRTLNNFLNDLRFIENERLTEIGEELLLKLSEQDA